jgi:antibiotic biosynthesis monooxygenase (ABM) superfamily enzyme
MNDGSQDRQEISKHIIALITFMALLPLVYFIPDFVGQFLPAIKWLNVIIVVGIIVPIISYGVMPIAYFFLIRCTTIESQ